MTEDRLMTIDEVATYLAVSVSAVRKWKREGKISFIKIEGKLRFHRDDVIAFVEARRSPVN